MNFNPDPVKQAQEVNFSTKTKKINHTSLKHLVKALQIKLHLKTFWCDS